MTVLPRLFGDVLPSQIGQPLNRLGKLLDRFSKSVRDGAILGSANAYLGLKVGLTISTSIPLAVIMVAWGPLSWLGLIPLMALFEEALDRPLFPDPFPAGTMPKLLSEMDASEIWNRYFQRCDIISRTSGIPPWRMR
ncbi:MAG: hypothetical protein V1495_10495 [Pseudomonadota bacterium]